MTTMRAVRTGAPGTVELVEVARPTPGPRDVLVRVRACGICGTDTFFVQAGGAPLPTGTAPLMLGHEPAGEVLEVGADVVGVHAGDHVVVNPMAAPSGLIGTGGPLGGMAELLLVEDAELGRTLQTVDQAVPFSVASLNEPMAVALHGVNRLAPSEQEQVVVFGAGPIGLGATIWLKLRGVRHVVVVDVQPDRLATALEVGADAVVDSSQEDVAARLTALHGSATNALGQRRPATDAYLDAAGAPQVLQTVQATARWGARLAVVAVHKKPVDLSGILRSELTILGSMGYPTEIFDVTPQLAEHWERFARIISHTVPLDEAQRAFDLALTPGAASKVVVVDER